MQYVSVYRKLLIYLIYKFRSPRKILKAPLVSEEAHKTCSQRVTSRLYSPC